MSDYSQQYNAEARAIMERSATQPIKYEDYRFVFRIGACMEDETRAMFETWKDTPVIIEADNANA